MSDRSTSTLPCSSNSLYAGSAAAGSPRVSTCSYSSAGVCISPYPRASNTPRTASAIACISRISSGRTSRVPLGVGWIVDTLGTLRDLALDARAERLQPLVDALVSAVDLADVVDLRLALRAQGGDQHRHAGADVRRGDALPAQPAGADDDRPVGVADRDLGAHRNQLVHEEQPVLEHLLEYEHRTLGLRGKRDDDRREVGGKRRPRAVLDLGLVVAGVARDDQLLVARDDHVGAVELRAEPQPAEREPDHAQVVGDAVLDP